MGKKAVASLAVVIQGTGRGMIGYSSLYVGKRIDPRLIGMGLLGIVILLGFGFVIAKTSPIFPILMVVSLPVASLFLAADIKKLGAFLVFSLPFLDIVILRTPIADFRVPQLIFIGVVSAIILRRLGGNFRKYNFDLPLALFVIVGFISVFPSKFPALALKNAIEMLLLAGVFRIIVWLGADFENLNSLINAWLWGISALIVAALVQVISSGGVVFPSFIISFPDVGVISRTNPFKLQHIGQGIARRIGIFGIGPVGLASVLLGALFLFFCKASEYRNTVGHKLLYYFMFIAGSFVVLLTYSRAAMVALLFSFFMYGVLFKRNRAFYVVFLAALIFVIGIGVPFLAARIREIAQPAEGAFASRLFLWLTALSIWRENLLVGTGSGTFVSVALDYNPLYYLSFFPRMYSVPDTHNMILQILAENGTIGLIAFLWFFYHVLKSGIKTLRLGTVCPPVVRALAVCLFAIFLMNLTLNDYMTETFWGLLGIVTGGFVAATGKRT